MNRICAQDGYGRRSRGVLKKAVAYIRVSTKRQEIGPEAQRRLIEQWAKRNRVIIVAWFEDRCSGARPLFQRKELPAAVRSVGEHQALMLVVAQHDRLSRKVSVGLEVELTLRLSGAAVVAADGIGNGAEPYQVFFRTLRLAYAELERHEISRRTRESARVLSAKGLCVGNPPFGFRRAEGSLKLEPEPAEQEMIQAIACLQRKGLGSKRIVAALGQAGYLSRNGLPLTRRTIRTVCERLKHARQGVVPNAGRHRMLERKPIQDLYREAAKSAGRLTFPACVTSDDRVPARQSSVAAR